MMGGIYRNLSTAIRSSPTSCLTLYAIRYLRHNHLTTLPEGLFDDLADLDKL